MHRLCWGRRFPPDPWQVVPPPRQCQGGGRVGRVFLGTPAGDCVFRPPVLGGISCCRTPSGLQRNYLLFGGSPLAPAFLLSRRASACCVKMLQEGLSQPGAAVSRSVGVAPFPGEGLPAPGLTGASRPRLSEGQSTDRPLLSAQCSALMRPPICARITSLCTN